MPTTAGAVGLANLQDFIRSVQAALERLEDAGHEATAGRLQDVREHLEDIRAQEGTWLEEEAQSVETVSESVSGNLEKASGALVELRSAVMDVGAVRREEDGASWADELASGREGMEATFERLGGSLEACHEALREGAREVQESKAATIAAVVELVEAVMDLSRHVEAESVRLVEGLEPDQQDLELQARKAEEAQHCSKVLGIVAAVVVVVVAVVVAVLGTGAAGPAVFMAAALCAVAVVAAVLTVVQNLGALLRLLGAVEAGDDVDAFLQGEAPALFLAAQVCLAVLALAAQTTTVVTAGETMASALQPMLPQVSVVSELAEGVERLLSALNPFD